MGKSVRPGSSQTVLSRLVKFRTKQLGA